MPPLHIMGNMCIAKDRVKSVICISVFKQSSAISHDILLIPIYKSNNYLHKFIHSFIHVETNANADSGST